MKKNKILSLIIGIVCAVSVIHSSVTFAALTENKMNNNTETYFEYEFDSSRETATIKPVENKKNTAKVTLSYLQNTTTTHTTTIVTTTVNSDTSTSTYTYTTTSVPHTTEAINTTSVCETTENMNTTSTYNTTLSTTHQPDAETTYQTNTDTTTCLTTTTSPHATTTIHSTSPPYPTYTSTTTTTVHSQSPNMIMMCSVSCSDEPGVILISGKTQGVYRLDEIGFKNITILRSSDSYNWIVEKNLGSMTSSNALMFILDNLKIEVAGDAYYMISCEHYAKNNIYKQNISNKSSYIWIKKAETPPLTTSKSPETSTQTSKNDSITNKDKSHSSTLTNISTAVQSIEKNESSPQTGVKDIDIIFTVIATAAITAYVTKKGTKKNTD